MNSSETLFLYLPLRSSNSALGLSREINSRNSSSESATGVNAISPDYPSKRSNQTILVQTNILPFSGLSGLVPKIWILAPRDSSRSECLSLSAMAHLPDDSYTHVFNYIISLIRGKVVVIARLHHAFIVQATAPRHLQTI